MSRTSSVYHSNGRVASSNQQGRQALFVAWPAAGRYVPFLGGHLERNLFMSLLTWMKQVVVVVSKARASPTAAARNLSFINRIGNRDVANYNKSYDGCSCLIG